MRAADQFKHFGLTPLASEKVAPPLIAESLGNVGCRVREYLTDNGLYLLVLEGVKA